MVGTVVVEFNASAETRATDEDCGAIINYEIAEVSISSKMSVQNANCINAI